MPRVQLTMPSAMQHHERALDRYVDKRLHALGHRGQLPRHGRYDDTRKYIPTDVEIRAIARIARLVRQQSIAETAIRDTTQWTPKALAKRQRKLMASFAL